MDDKNKNPNGRPPKFNDVESLENMIDEYFDQCPDKRPIATATGITEVPCPTITGLALFLGFCSRQSMYDYEANEKFTYTIKRARTFIEREYEKQLHSGSCGGAIFALKNMGWKDTQDITSGGFSIKPEPTTVTFINARKKADD